MITRLGTHFVKGLLLLLVLTFVFIGPSYGQSSRDDLFQKLQSIANKDRPNSSNEADSKRNNATRTQDQTKSTEKSEPEETNSARQYSPLSGSSGWQIYGKFETGRYTASLRESRAGGGGSSNSAIGVAADTRIFGFGGAYSYQFSRNWNLVGAFGINIKQYHSIPGPLYGNLHTRRQGSFLSPSKYGALLASSSSSLLSYNTIFGLSANSTDETLLIQSIYINNGSSLFDYEFSGYMDYNSGSNFSPYFGVMLELVSLQFIRETIVTSGGSDFWGSYTQGNISTQNYGFIMGVKYALESVYFRFSYGLKFIQQIDLDVLYQNSFIELAGRVAPNFPYATRVPEHRGSLTTNSFNELGISVFYPF